MSGIRSTSLTAPLLYSHSLILVRITNLRLARRVESLGFQAPQDHQVFEGFESHQAPKAVGLHHNYSQSSF